MWPQKEALECDRHFASLSVACNKTEKKINGALLAVTFIILDCGHLQFNEVLPWASAITPWSMHVCLITLLQLSIPLGCIWYVCDGCSFGQSAKFSVTAEPYHGVVFCNWLHLSLMNLQILLEFVNKDLMILYRYKSCDSKYEVFVQILVTTWLWKKLLQKCLSKHI